ncbi:hypothetical protein E0Z10_g10807 [Xylaria hypoxylon]|uniref:Uncharacterized protein n=1 Tax=Xylaria hypoxylon TaxID=37992 RepID=A0A4Z0YDF4_9PEZI|nr:hypothetical protein E0Z10_g10807 [Xylaria hypoxylon]
MSPTSTAHKLSPTRLLTFGASVLYLATPTNAWLLEFWSGQADCNYKIGDNGAKAGADSSRGGEDHTSNNCMSLSYDPDTYGLVAMRVSGWTGDCAIALWSDTAGSVPCQGEVPVPLGGDYQWQRPDWVFTTKSREVVMAQDEDGDSYTCISPLYDFIKTGSGFLGYVAYSCGDNGTILVDEFEKHYNADQIESLIESFTDTATSTASAASTHKSSKVTSHTSHKHTGTAPAGNSSAVSPTSNKLRLGLPPRPTEFIGRGLY